MPSEHVKTSIAGCLNGGVSGQCNWNSCEEYCNQFGLQGTGGTFQGQFCVYTDSGRCEPESFAISQGYVIQSCHDILGGA
jgi:hypothetical protein